MPKPAPKKTIAVDIDDVLAANAEGFVKFSNERWGTNLKPDDYSEHWAEVWGVDFEEVNKRREVIVAEKLFTTHRFLEDTKSVLFHLEKSYRLIVVSSRSRSIQADTIAWLNKEFGDVFEEIHFAGIWDKTELHILERLKLTKAEILREIGADYLIDDQPKHCIAAAGAGIKTLLFGDYGWNRNTKLIPNMTRVSNWAEVKEYFNAKSGR